MAAATATAKTQTTAPAAPTAAPVGPTAVPTAKATKPKRERKDRGATFSQKARYVGPMAKLTLHVREVDPNKFKVFAFFEKPGATADKIEKEKGLMSEHPTKDEAVAKFNELAEQVKAAGWALQSTVSKSAFTTIPPVQ